MPTVNESGESLPPTPTSLRPPVKGVVDEMAAAFAVSHDESAGGGGGDDTEARLQELTGLHDRRPRRRTSKQLAASLSQEMVQFAVLPTELAGTYSRHAGLQKSVAAPPHASMAAVPPCTEAAARVARLRWQAPTARWGGL